ncbi:MAG: ACT domain-containing protein [Eubacteriales bacterium]|nr:ACT domain-containing protein [Eubacteriales bacterium]
MSGKNTGYYLIRKRAVPEVLQKVVEVNKLLASGGAKTVNEAAEKIGISRSSYYKFKDDIEEFHDSSAGTTLTLFAEINDETGLLSDMLRIIAQNKANILTIHQSIPLNGVASLSISIQITEDTGNVSAMLAELEHRSGVRKVKVTGRE